MKIRIMTSNIWGDFFGNPVPPRAPLLAAVYARYTPDVLGLQEAGPSWWKSSLIPALLENYAQVPVDTGEFTNCIPVFYRKDRFELLDSGAYLYHVELDYSKGWNCGVLKDRESGKTFAVFNTHFWWKPELRDDVIRRYNAMDMVRAMEQTAKKYGCPVFFTGDLNCKYDSMAWKYLRGRGWRTSYACTDDHSACSSNHHDPVIHPDGTCTGSTTDEPVEFSIDHIGIPEGIKVLRQYAVVDREALDASDHSPIYADVEI